ncbi:MAG: patatin-like phospholipase family protein [Bacteroidota bacterium]
MSLKKFILLGFITGLLIGLNNNITAQKVGLVLSGGGAKGLAHIGVIKALEENNIPIDYVAGTSMGAIVGGMYAIGMTPEEMRAMATSERFIKMAKGEIDGEYKYYFKQRDVNASWITLKIARDTIWQTSLPTSLISTVAIDFFLMEKLSGPSAAANYNFDSLFVPFRCVAADIAANKELIFREGHLNEAIRASASFPFYIQPITVDNKLLFDGGLYNNFPTDVMYNHFFPDIIIGSNVSGKVMPPDEDNVISQIKNMLMNRTNFTVICENGILIEPNLGQGGLFDFSEIEAIIDSGYFAALSKIEDIKTAIPRRVDKRDLTQKREFFKSKQPPLLFDEIYVDGLNKLQSKYVRNILSHKKRKPSDINDIKPGYFKVFGDDKIKNMYPNAEYNRFTGLYDLFIKVKKEKDIIIDFGGNFSSRSINETYIGAQYNYLGRTAFSLKANTYFGKLYGSVQFKGRMDFPVKLPFYLEPEITYNRWDYFKSSEEFFEDKKPSYFVQKEKFGGINIGFSVNNTGKGKAGFSIINLEDYYYQTQEFSHLDTADKTEFNGLSAYLSYERSTLNHKQYANKGTYFVIQGRFVEGEEYNLPGSTSSKELHHLKLHDWAQFKFIYDTYYKQRGNLRLGFYAEGVFSTQEFFNNYSASILRAPAFQPTPDSKSQFLESFRAHRYIAVGHKIILNLWDDIDLRLEGYMFQPYQEILRQNDNTAKYGPEFDRRYTIATVAAVYHSPIGQVSISLNYYHNVPEVAQEDKTPLTFLFHFGYIIFNRRGLD